MKKPVSGPAVAIRNAMTPSNEDYEETDSMRLRNIPSARQELAESPFVINEAGIPGLRGRWSAFFGNDHPLRLEIGMGKGQFLLELARRNPDINYVGIERYSSVLVHPVRRLDALLQADEGLRNLSLLRMDAERLTEAFAPGEVDRIYLNFSDPWPKDRHAKRRLPGRVYLGRYAQVLSPGGMVEFKTDNRSLFDFALGEAREAGWTIDACTYDLHHDPALNADNILTEYEMKFSALGNPIYKLIEHPGA